MLSGERHDLAVVHPSNNHNLPIVDRNHLSLLHLGILFGLTEEATVVVLIDMVLLEKRATGVTQICQQQWEHLRDFHQLRGVLEWGNSQLAGERSMYIRIGFISLSPAQIYQRYNKPKTRMAPQTRFGGRPINEFVM